MKTRSQTRKELARAHAPPKTPPSVDMSTSSDNLQNREISRNLFEGFNTPPGQSSTLSSNRVFDVSMSSSPKIILGYSRHKPKDPRVRRVPRVVKVRHSSRGSLTSSILQRVDETIRRQVQERSQRHRDNSSSSSEDNSSTFTFQDTSSEISPVPSLPPYQPSSEMTAPKYAGKDCSTSSQPEYTPEDTEFLATLPPAEVRETALFAFSEEYYGDFLSKKMRDADFKDPLPPPPFISMKVGVYAHWKSSPESTLYDIPGVPLPQRRVKYFEIHSGSMLDELQDLIQPLCIIPRADRRLSCSTRMLRPDLPLYRQGVRNHTWVYVHPRLRGGTDPDSEPEDSISGEQEEDNHFANDDGDGETGPAENPLRVESPFSVTSDIMAANSADVQLPTSASIVYDNSRLRHTGHLASVPEVEQSSAQPSSFGRLIRDGHKVLLNEAGIDPRLAAPDDSFHRRITLRKRHPRRRDSDYALRFQPEGAPATRHSRMAPPAHQKLDPSPTSLHDRSVMPPPPSAHRSFITGTAPRYPRTPPLAPPHDPRRVLVRKSITMPSFSGLTRDWTTWSAGVERYFEVHGLGHVLDIDYLQSSQFDYEDNKLVYFTLEMSISSSAKAQSIFRRAPRLDGNTAFLQLYDGYTLSGIAAAPLLLQRLTNFRLREGEDVFSFVLRLTDLFDELSRLPGEASCDFTDNQKVHYLLASIRHEPNLAFLYENLQTQQSRGQLTFDVACDDLQLRYETLRSDDLLQAKSARKQQALISTEGKRLYPTLKDKNRDSNTKDPVTYTLCLADGCTTRDRTPLCRLHYAELVCGKTPEMLLRDNLGTVTYDARENRAVYPATVPSERTKSQPRAGRSKSRNSTRNSSGGTASSSNTRQ